MQIKPDKYQFDKAGIFAPISLEEMDKVKLMNRTDTKYWFHAKNLQDLLETIHDSYFILTMHNEFALPYTTTYYDTKTNGMYTAHHNGKLNRYKIRRRTYISSNLSFLEIKFKTNKGRTIKKRIPSNFENSSFNEAENTFIQSITPFSAEDLTPSLINNFLRITLVNKNFNERCTIDFNLNFRNSNRQVALNNLVIAEIKADGQSSVSPLTKALRNQRIKTSGFSKYCIGRAVTDSTLKQNAFKHKVREIAKIINTPILCNI